MVPDIFRRTELMLGTPALDALAATRVAIFGLGGVGSWCAEALVRSGVGKLLLVDSDCVAVTNVNRQLMATTATVGQVKVEVLARRLKEINPAVELDVRADVYSAATAARFGLEGYDYVVDAIDSLENKAHLIRHALSIPTVTLFASMGAALKLDPLQIRATDFRKVEGDGLARALRQKFRQTAWATRSSPTRATRGARGRPASTAPSRTRRSSSAARSPGSSCRTSQRVRVSDRYPEI